MRETACVLQGLQGGAQLDGQAASTVQTRSCAQAGWACVEMRRGRALASAREERPPGVLNGGLRWRAGALVVRAGAYLGVPLFGFGMSKEAPFCKRSDKNGASASFLEEESTTLGAPRGVSRCPLPWHCEFTNRFSAKRRGGWRSSEPTEYTLLTAEEASDTLHLRLPDGRPILFWVLVLVGACQSGTVWAGLCLIHHHHQPRKQAESWQNSGAGLLVLVAWRRERAKPLTASQRQKTNRTIDLSFSRRSRSLVGFPINTTTTQAIGPYSPTSPWGLLSVLVMHRIPVKLLLV